MSQISDLIMRYNQKLADSEHDNLGIITLLSEYRRSVKDLSDCVDEVNNILSSMITGSGGRRLDLVLIAVAIHPSEVYVDSLCALLALGNERLPNEQIVELLRKIPSTKAVPCLAKVCLRSFAYDAYDEFNVKCLDALFAINTRDAWEVIEENLHASSPRVRDHATELMALRPSS